MSRPRYGKDDRLNDVSICGRLPLVALCGFHPFLLVWLNIIQVRRIHEDRTDLCSRERLPKAIGECHLPSLGCIERHRFILQDRIRQTAG